MRHRYILTLFIIYPLMTGSVLAQETRYRVELLVLTHLDYLQNPQEVKWLTDYSQAVDFLAPPKEEAEEEIEEGIEDQAVVVHEVIPEIAEIEEADPNALIHIEEMSDVMQETWRRLRQSRPFRPEQYLSWEQGNQAPFPTLRVHDQEVLLVDDPYAELRLELLEQEAEASDDRKKETIFVDAAGLDALDENEEPALPDPTLYYRLDGNVTLKRSRFLHLELGLQLREPVWDEVTPAITSIESPENEEPTPSAFLVHELRQSRQVKSGRMEYFDGPVLGVLVFITAIEADIRLEAE